MAVDQVTQRRDVDPSTVDGIDRLSARAHCLRLERMAENSPRGSARGQAETGHQRCAPGDPSLVWRLLERLRQALAECGMHALRALAGSSQPRGGGDRSLLLGVAPAQL